MPISFVAMESSGIRKQDLHLKLGSTLAKLQSTLNPSGSYDPQRQTSGRAGSRGTRS